jgi:NADH-quinone oxidoreductase subunit I
MILAWVNDIYEGVNSFLVGMRTTATFLVENLRGTGGGNAVTRQYPQQPAVTVGERVRGHLVNDGERCIVCTGCAKACPVDCFVMEGERDENNKMRASRFEIDLSKCIYCGLCLRVCPTDSLSMTADFQVDPVGKDGRYLFRQNSAQRERKLDMIEMARLNQLAKRSRAELSPEERAWLDGVCDPEGQHLVGIFGLGYYTPEEKARVDQARDEKKKAKEAAAAAAKAAKPATPPAPGASA